MQRLLIVILAFVLLQPAQAQILNTNPVSQDAVTPGEMAARLETLAKRYAPNGGLRVASVDLCWPSSPTEYAAFGKYMLLLVTVVTRNPAELPLRRVFIEVDGKSTNLIKLGSGPGQVRKGSLTASMLGSNREDGFYLAPTGLMASYGKLKADFAVNRDNFDLYSLPGTPPDYIKADAAPMPADARPDLSAVKALFQREYKGFALPVALR